MESLDYWRLCDELSIIQAALLIVGKDPSESQEYIEMWEPHKRPKGFEAAKSALKAAVNSKKIVAKVRYSTMDSSEPDWHISTVSVDSLKQWLVSRGFTSGFFFPEKQYNLPYLDVAHPQYAPKLAVAIMAWEAVTNNRYLLRNKTPKKAIGSWLETNAEKYGLTKQAIEEIAKIANWNTKGGAPTTYSGITEEQAIKEDITCVDDDEIYF